MTPEFDTIFVRLRSILQNHAGSFKVKPDTAVEYGLLGEVGPAMLRAWGGKLKRHMMPVAWVTIGKAYVSYHMMGMYGNTRLSGSMSKKINAPMQGKTCFNFKTNDEELFRELELLTIKCIADFRKAGFIL